MQKSAEFNIDLNSEDNNGRTPFFYACIQAQRKVVDLMIKNSAEYFEPHRITNYLHDLSKTFHNYWGLGNIDKKKK